VRLKEEKRQMGCPVKRVRKGRKSDGRQSKERGSKKFYGEERGGAQLMGGLERKLNWQTERKKRGIKHRKDYSRKKLGEGTNLEEKKSSAAKYRFRSTWVKSQRWRGGGVRKFLFQESRETVGRHRQKERKLADVTKGKQGTRGKKRSLLTTVGTEGNKKRSHNPNTGRKVFGTKGRKRNFYEKVY